MENTFGFTLEISLTSVNTVARVSLQARHLCSTFGFTQGRKVAHTSVNTVASASLEAAPSSNILIVFTQAKSLASVNTVARVSLQVQPLRGTSGSIQERSLISVKTVASVSTGVTVFRDTWLGFTQDKRLTSVAPV